MDIQKSYEDFLRLSKRIAYNWAMTDLLIWDQRIVTQSDGSDHRAALVAHQAGLVQASYVSPEYVDTVQRLNEARQAGLLDALQAANVTDAVRKLHRRQSLPQELVEDTANAAALSQGAWVQARKSGDDASYLEALRHLVALKRQEATLLCATSPYDGLLPEFEPETTSAQIHELFEALKDPLQKLLRSIQRQDIQPLSLSRSQQEEMARAVVTRMGFRGRIDILENSHPFTIRIHPGDVRCVVRYSEDAQGIIRSATHEAGHCLYEQSLPAEHFGTAAGAYTSLGLHESQSRLWEVCFFGSRPGSQFLHSLLHSIANGAAPSIDGLQRRANTLNPSLIRVESDPLNYLFHIFLRFNIERDLINGKLEVDDLPKAWNDAIREYFGLEVPHVAKGYAQDPHWAGGSFGYFPTYALGMLYAAQLWFSLQRDIPNLDALIAQGSFEDVHSWLNQNVWRYGATQSARKTVTCATGTEPDSTHLLRLFEERLNT